MADLACSACRKGLERRAYKGFPIDQCGRCDGVWLGSETIGAMLFAAENRSPNSDPAGLQWEERAGESAERRLCPCCGAVMGRFASVPSRIVVERCPGHGAWLDVGELQALQAVVEGNPPPALGGRPEPRRWTCGSCGERVEFEFTHCWKCQAEAPEAARSLVGPSAPALRPVAPPAKTSWVQEYAVVAAVLVPIALGGCLLGGAYLGVIGVFLGPILVLAAIPFLASDLSRWGRRR